MLRKGDTLVVWKLNILGRSIKTLIALVGNLNSKEIHFKSLTDVIDTSTPSGRFFFHVMASLAEMERELIIERTKAGLGAAKKLLDSGVLPKDVTNNLGVSLATLYRWIPANHN